MDTSAKPNSTQTNSTEAKSAQAKHTQAKSTDSEYPEAGLARRLCAMAYDTLLVAAIVMIGGAIAVGLRVALSGSEAAVADPATAAHGLLYQAWLACLVFGFFIVFWRWNGQTVGMLAWRLQVRNETNREPSLQQCALRLIGAAVSFATLGLGYWVLLIPGNTRSWPDKLSGTRVIVLPKKSGPGQS